MCTADVQHVAVGFFDGVHLGHKAILKNASVALTFRNHPLSVLSPENSPRLLMTPEKRFAAIKAAGPSIVEVLDFTAETAAMTPERFVETVLLRRFGKVHVHCGANWRFGAGGAGDAGTLRSLGLEVTVASYAMHGGGAVSSTRIRRALEDGDVEEANAMLGYAFSVRGDVFRGKGRGVKIGFPTVNLDLHDLKLDLPLGVYEVSACGRRGIANYGIAPTMGADAWTRPVLEIHFPQGEPKGTTSTMEVDFLRFIRPEMKFGSVDELKARLEVDLGLL